MAIWNEKVGGGDRAVGVTQIPQAIPMPKSRIRVQWRPQMWMQWLHRWATFTLGIVLLVTTFSGTMALFTPDLNRLTHQQMYRVTPAATPASLDLAYATVVQAIANDPALRDVHASGTVDAAPGTTYAFDLRDADNQRAGTAFVDPGTGTYLGHYNSRATIWYWFTDLHTDLFANDIEFTYPEWVPEWARIFIGEDLAELMLKNVALLLLIMVVTGAYLWWPGIKKLAYGMRVRRGAKGYVWHYEWHKVLGFVSLPFLFMWAITGLNFYDPYSDSIGSIWYAATFSAKPPEAPKVKSKPTGNAMISLEAAKRAGLAAVPGASVTSLTLPTKADGTLNVRLAKDIDPRAYADRQGWFSVSLDAYSGELLDNPLTRETWASHVLQRWFFPIHAGRFASWPVRLIWAFFGLMPTFLAFTGVMQWWLKRRKYKERLASRRAVVA